MCTIAIAVHALHGITSYVQPILILVALNEVKADFAVKSDGGLYSSPGTIICL